MDGPQAPGSPVRPQKAMRCLSPDPPPLIQPFLKCERRRRQQAQAHALLPGTIYGDRPPVRGDLRAT